ncbi:hypothetical protein CEB3_c35640 [Peptococcaceae bacterium CEB3]|nr:hypothetical protein CEB3_c35640 [Peptococcaceae bacterium CEB3]
MLVRWIFVCVDNVDKSVYKCGGRVCEVSVRGEKNADLSTGAVYKVDKSAERLKNGLYAGDNFVT